jgi:hypothetical protein
VEEATRIKETLGVNKGVKPRRSLPYFLFIFSIRRAAALRHGQSDSSIFSLCLGPAAASPVLVHLRDSRAAAEHTRENNGCSSTNLCTQERFIVR